MAGEKTFGGAVYRIRHTMLPVSDLDRSIDFYTRLFGMDIQRVRDAPDGSERVAYVGYGSDDDGHGMELVQTGAPGSAGKVPPWTGHVAINVSDMHKVCAQLKSEGVTFLQEPTPNRPGSRDMTAFIRDCDGYTLELTERHSKSGPPVKIT